MEQQCLPIPGWTLYTEQLGKIMVQLSKKCKRGLRQDTHQSSLHFAVQPTVLLESTVDDGRNLPTHLLSDQAPWQSHLLSSAKITSASSSLSPVPPQSLPRASSSSKTRVWFTSSVPNDLVFLMQCLLQYTPLQTRQKKNLAVQISRSFQCKQYDAHSIKLAAQL